MTHPFGSDAWLDQAREELPGKACPVCRTVGGMSIDWRYLATGGALAGVQPRVPVERRLVITCWGCGFAARVSEDTGS